MQKKLKEVETQRIDNLKYYMSIIAKMENKSLSDYLEDDKRMIDKEIESLPIELYYKDYFNYKAFKEELKDFTYNQLFEELKSIPLSDIHPQRFALILDGIYNYQEENDYDEISLKLIFEELEYDCLNELLSLIKFIPCSILLEHFFTGTMKTILSSLKLHTVNDLLNLKTEILFILFSKNKKQFYDLLVRLNDVDERSLYEKIDELESKLKEKDLYFDVLTQRNGIYGKKMIYKDIASLHDIPIESIRNIDSKARRLTLSFVREINHSIEACLSKLLKGRLWIEKHEIEDYFDERITNYMKYFAHVHYSRYEYHEKYEIFYLRSQFCDVIDELLKCLPIIITNDQYKNYSLFMQRFIHNFYSRRDFAYLHPNTRLSDIYSSIVEEYFPDGFIIDEENIKIVNHQLLKYGLKEVSLRSFYMTLLRTHYHYVDKHRLKNNLYLVQLPQDLVNRIMNYIFLSNKSIPYLTLYIVFKEELDCLGIMNHYHLKSALTPYIDGLFECKKDKIKVKEYYK